MQKILELYKERGFFHTEFYELLKMCSIEANKFYTDNPRFLQNTEISQENLVKNPILTVIGDIRVDLPVWFGDFNKCRKKIMLIGLEPRDTDKSGKLNIERSGNYVYATPFALELREGKYQTAFEKLNQQEDIFVYYTDVVKTYDVTENKKHDDKEARKTFKQKAEKWKSFLEHEINLIKPDKILALGRQSERFLRNLGLAEELAIVYIRHPSYGGQIKAKEMVFDVLVNLKD